MTTLHDRAPAKINLCLFVGPTRADGRHELVTVMDTLDLADELACEVGPGGLAADRVDCPGVDGPNLAAAALEAFRSHTGWDGPPLRLRIAKRIPVAGGMAGGSADAAAALRLAARAAGLDDPGTLEEIAEGLGSDVPSQVRGGCMLVEGGGERLRPLPPRPAYTALVVPVRAHLSAGAVYAAAERLGLTRDAAGLVAAHDQAVTALQDGIGVVHNDLQDAARSLCPAIDDALALAAGAGAGHALVSGSGPTVLGLFTGADHAERAARGLGRVLATGREPAVLLAGPDPRTR